MPAPVLQSISIAAESTTSSLAMNAPSGVVSGDFLVAIAICEERRQADTPTGWSLAHYIQSGTVNIGQTVFYRVADGSADDTPTITFPAAPSQGATGFILRINGQASSGAFDTSASAFSAFTSVLAVPTATVADNDSLCLLFVSHAALSQTCSVDTGWSEVLESSGAYTSVAAYHQTAAAGTSPAGTITWSGSGRHLASVVIIKPAAGSAGNSRYYQQQQHLAA